eukprot:scaffold4001_cov94-Cylindrotheca_fusiformis.AAC.7
MVYRTFPFRLHQMIEEASTDEVESTIISWTPSGESFKIHDRDAFSDRILPKHLPNQNKYKSFKRQLQYYGFVNFGSQHYGHPSFRRGQKSLLSQIEHKAFNKSKNKRRNSSSSSDPLKQDKSELLEKHFGAKAIPGFVSLQNQLCLEAKLTDLDQSMVSLSRQYQQLAHAEALRSLAIAQHQMATLQSGNAPLSLSQLAFQQRLAQYQAFSKY